ncbi:hypothetical protein [Nocardiopsis sp. LOL_012]|uniref:hypothetical protein n=1 Tax=Nocardiopsis sp. LOL_012 TaxID=3345409 RepID=UPI003A8A44DC
MITTDTRAPLRPALDTTVLVTSVVLLVVLTLPFGSGFPGPASQARPAAEEAVAAHGGDPAGEYASVPADHPVLADGPTVAACDQRSAPRDLPDAVPACALRLAAWEQPWWPLERPQPDPLPEQAAAGELPPTRAPPLTALSTT